MHPSMRVTSRVQDRPAGSDARKRLLDAAGRAGVTEPAREVSLVTAAPTQSVRGFARSTGSRPAIRAEGVKIATVVAAAALILLVGHDGTPGWQVARAMAVVLLSGAVLVGEARSGDRARGLLAAGIGIAVLAAGGGYLPFVAKDPASLEAVAGSAAALSGLFLTAAGVGIGTRGRARLHRVAAGITGAGHTAGLRTAAVEWERRVIGFLSGVLAVPGQR